MFFYALIILAIVLSQAPWINNEWMIETQSLEEFEECEVSGVWGVRCVKRRKF